MGKRLAVVLLLLPTLLVWITVGLCVWIVKGRVQDWPSLLIEWGTK